MKHSSCNRLQDFEFHDAVLSLISWEDDVLVLSAKYLNLHKDAAPDNTGTDMEIADARITFSGFEIKEFEPSRVWQRDGNGNSYTNDPLIIYTNTIARKTFEAELRNSIRVMGITFENEIYDLGALGIDPYFSARFVFSSVEIEWNTYSQRAWYCGNEPSLI